MEKLRTCYQLLLASDGAVQLVSVLGSVVMSVWGMGMV
jgi:hypothetical protein